MSLKVPGGSSRKFTGRASEEVSTENAEAEENEQEQENGQEQDSAQTEEKEVEE